MKFLLKENLIHPHYIFSHIHIISTFYSYIAYYYQKKKLFILKTTWHNNKNNASQFLKKTASGGLKASLHLTYLLQSEFHTIIGTLYRRKKNQF